MSFLADRATACLVASKPRLVFAPVSVDDSLVGEGRSGLRDFEEHSDQYWKGRLFIGGSRTRFHRLSGSPPLEMPLISFQNP